ncbi:hypothetical protein FRX31_022511, partial [Thalictrum thalictroides]
MVDDNSEDEQIPDDNWYNFAEQLEEEMIAHDAAAPNPNNPNILFPHEFQPTNGNRMPYNDRPQGWGRRGNLAFRRIRNQRLREENFDDYGRWQLHQSFTDTTTETSSST